jgi:hypothetical protein
MIKWRAFDHVSFGLVCLLVVFGLFARMSLADVGVVAVSGMVWVVYHTYTSSQEADYRMSPTARGIAISLYGLSLIGGLILWAIRMG